MSKEFIYVGKSGMATYNANKLWGMMGNYSKQHLERSQWPNPTIEHIEEGFDVLVEKFKPLNEEMCNSLAEDPAKARCLALEYFHVVAHVPILSHLEKYGVENGEERLTAIIRAYDSSIDAGVFKTTCGKQNWMHSGLFLYQLCFQYGSMGDLDTWHEKVVRGYKPLSLQTSHNYKDKAGTLCAEVGDATITALPVLVMLGEKEKAAELLASLGFALDDIGFIAWYDIVKKHSEPLGDNIFSRETWYTLCKLLLFLSLPEAEVEKCSGDIKNWIPEPTKLAECNKAWMTQGDCTLNILTKKAI